ncbi:hypothetical protein I4U23_029253 [Adineta vaga]|nr:hypothetical protein I4U23_029253 [Adineta vaga]
MNLNTCTDGDQCIHFLRTIEDSKACICMIISGSLGQLIVPQGVFTEIKPICEALKQVAAQFEKNAASMSFVASGKKFAEQNISNSDLVAILFVMTIDPKQSTTAFASNLDFSDIAGEDEVLFSMHSVFRIQDIKQMDGNNKLSLNDKAPIYGQLGWIKYNRGEYEEAIRFYEKSLSANHAWSQQWKNDLERVKNKL